VAQSVDVSSLHDPDCYIDLNNHVTISWFGNEANLKKVYRSMYSFGRKRSRHLDWS